MHQQKAVNGNNQVLFWDMVAKESEFNKKLAKQALSSLLGKLENSLLGKQYLMNVRNCFEKLKLHKFIQHAKDMESKYDDMTKQTVSLEQKNTKLKALLARTHQANQKNIEDNHLFKRAQEEALMELKSIKQRDESERKFLLEQVRMRSIESEFKYDVELSIQLAVDEMISQRNAVKVASPGGGGSKDADRNQRDLQLEFTTSTQQQQQQQQELSSLQSLVHELQTTKGELISQMEILQLEHEHLREQYNGLKESMAPMESRMASLQLSLANKDKEIRRFEMALKDEGNLRKDMEIELNLTVKSRAEMIQEFHEAAEVKYSSKFHEYNQQISELRTKLLDAEVTITQLQDNVKKNKDEMERMRPYQRDLKIAESEIATLRSTIAELKRVHAQQSHSNGSSQLSNGNYGSHGSGVAVLDDACKSLIQRLIDDSIVSAEDNLTKANMIHQLQDELKEIQAKVSFILLFSLM